MARVHSRQVVIWNHTIAPGRAPLAAKTECGHNVFSLGDHALDALDRQRCNEIDGRDLEPALSIQHLGCRHTRHAHHLLPRRGQRIIVGQSCRLRRHHRSNAATARAVHRLFHVGSVVAGPQVHLAQVRLNGERPQSGLHCRGGCERGAGAGTLLVFHASEEANAMVNLRRKGECAHCHRHHAGANVAANRHHVHSGHTLDCLPSCPDLHPVANRDAIGRKRRRIGGGHAVCLAGTGKDGNPSRHAATEPLARAIRILVRAAEMARAFERVGAAFGRAIRDPARATVATAGV